jgi:hypothetical protein
LRAAAVCLFVKSESFDTFGPHTLGQSIEKSKNTFQPSAFCHLLTCQLIKLCWGFWGSAPWLRHLNGVEKTGVQICGGMKGVLVERIFRQNILIGWESLSEAVNQIAQNPVVLQMVSIF